MMRAFDMSKYQRIIATEGRIRGDWKVLGGVGRNPENLIVVPIDVVIYDHDRRSGRCFYSNDFHVTIEDGKVNLRVDGADKFKMLEIEDVRADFDATMMLVAQAYKEGVGSVVEPEVFSMKEGDRG
jgi:hypothetical protein